MSDVWAKTTLKLYSGLGSALYPFAGPFLRARARRGKEDLERRAERYGYASWERPEGPLVWLHAASVGESLAIMPLIKRMESFGISLVLTTGTVTSAGVAEQRLSERTVHQYVPIDMKRAVSRFLDHWKPDLAIFAESEIWPITIEQLAKRQVPQILVNARMSDRSNKRWTKRSSLANAIFSKLSLVIAQSALDAERFSRLGAPSVSTAGNLKIDVGVPAADPAGIAKVQGEIGDRPTWLAISTHKGEEESVALVHRILANQIPNLLTVLIPRHPDRTEDVLADIAKHGLNVTSRSSQAPITPETQVFLGDTIGEMGLYLRLAKIAFMGKSLKAQGGQNPIEPAVTDTAILTGRYVQNFRETYEALLEAGGAKLIKDEKMLAQQVFYLLKHPQECQKMQAGAAAAVQKMAGALDRTIEQLDPYITPLRVQASLERRTREDANELALAAIKPE